jgi:hypothetical protein
MTYQNGTDWEIWVLRDDGTRLGILDTVSNFTWTLVVNNTGHFRVEVVIPPSVPGLAAGRFATGAPAIQASWFAKDRRILFWRKPATGAMKLAFVGIIRRLRQSRDARGLHTFRVSGHDLTGLLKRRVIAYAAASAQAAMTDQADDILTELAKDNLGTDATSARQISSTYFSVAASPGAGPSITKGFSYRNLLDVMREVADAARQVGTFLFFGIEALTETTFGFRTRTGEWGRDRTSDVGNGLIFGEAFGNLANPVLDDDSTDEVNFAYGLGRGEEAAREVQTSEDTTRSGASVYARAEAAANAVLESTSAGVADVADARVQKGRPVVMFTADLLSVPGSEFGKDWDHGDRVTATAFERQFDCLIRATTVTVDDAWRETIAPIIEAIV